MHEATPYGYLAINERAIGMDVLARMVGVDYDQTIELVAELEQHGVFSRHKNGTIYCRRMVRDEGLRNRRRSYGKLGGIHGVKGKDHGDKGGRPKQNNPPNNPPSEKNKGGLKTPSKPPPSSSSSSSSSINTINPLLSQSDGDLKVEELKNEKPPATKKKTLREVLGETVTLYPSLKIAAEAILSPVETLSIAEQWYDLRTAKKCPQTPRAWKVIVEKLITLSGGVNSDAFRMHFEDSYVNGWKSVFPLKNQQIRQNGQPKQSRSAAYEQAARHAAGFAGSDSQH